MELHAAFISAYIVCERCVRPTKTYWWKPVIQFSRYATVDTTNVLSSYFMTVDMHRFAFLWLVHMYSRNKFFRMGPKNLFPGEQILGGSKLMWQECSNAIQFPARFLKRDSPPAPPGTTEISLSDNVAYGRCNHEKDQTDDHQYEKLDEYQAWPFNIYRLQIDVCRYSVAGCLTCCVATITIVYTYGSLGFMVNNHLTPRVEPENKSLL